MSPVAFFRYTLVNATLALHQAIMLLKTCMASDVNPLACMTLGAKCCWSRNDSTDGEKEVFTASTNNVGMSRESKNFSKSLNTAAE